MPKSSESGQNRTQPTRCRLAGSACGFATSRAQSMKSRATGLIVRPFNVTIATGLRNVGSFTGRTLTEKFLAPNRSTDAGQIANKFPLASRTFCAGNEWQTTSARGISRPLAVKFAAITALASAKSERWRQSPI